MASTSTPGAHGMVSAGGREAAQAGDDRFFELSLDLVCVASFAGYLTRVNAAWTRLLGWTAEELSEIPYVERIHPDDQERTVREATRIAESGGETHDFELRFRARDGRWVWLLFSAQAAPDEAALYCVAKDITERKRAEAALREAEERFRSAFDNAPIGIALTGTDGRFIQANRALAQIVDRSVDELAGMEVREVTHPEDSAADTEAMRSMVAGETKTFRRAKRYLRPDGTPTWVDLSVVLVRDADDQPAYFISQMLDINVRREAEAELERRNAELQRSNSELEQFAYVASHDLSEPLRMVSGFVQLLQTRYEGRLDADADEFIGFTVDGVNRMQELINDLLAYSRVGRSEREDTPVDCNVVLETTYRALASMIDSTGADIEAEPLPIVHGERRELVQLMQNLLSNALKFGDPEMPRVHIGARRDGAFWHLHVADNGIGIEPHHADRIFKMFQRLHGHDEYPGTGIGLAICKKIVDRGGGRIWVEPNADGGSAFHFTLPAEEAPAA